MFGGLPKLLLLVLVVIAVLYAIRQFNKLRQEWSGRQMPRSAPGPQPRRARPVVEAEELVVCRVCGTYLAVSARHCGKSGCPQPR